MSLSEALALERRAIPERLIAARPLAPSLTDDVELPGPRIKRDLPSPYFRPPAPFLVVASGWVSLTCVAVLAVWSAPWP